MNVKEIKLKAKEFAFKNKWNVWKAYLLILLIPFVVGFVTGIVGIDPESTIGKIITLVLDLLIIPLSIGFISYILKLIRGEYTEVSTELFSKYNIFGTIFLTMLIIAICTFGWTLLFIIPGIIYGYKVIMSNYLLADTDAADAKASTIIEKSKKMMDGHKWEFFVFQLSFIGWFFLSIITLGIAIIWFYPYYVVANTMYYDELKKLTTPVSQPENN